MRHDFKDCDLRVANYTAREGLVEILGVSFEMNFLHKRSIAWYSLKICTSCLCVLTSSDSMVAVGAGSGITG